MTALAWSTPHGQELKFTSRSFMRSSSAMVSAYLHSGQSRIVDTRGSDRKDTQRLHTIYSQYSNLNSWMWLERKRQRQSNTEDCYAHPSNLPATPILHVSKHVQHWIHQDSDIALDILQQCYSEIFCMTTVVSTNFPTPGNYMSDRTRSSCHLCAECRGLPSSMLWERRFTHVCRE